MAGRSRSEVSVIGMPMPVMIREYAIKIQRRAAQHSVALLKGSQMQHSQMHMERD